MPISKVFDRCPHDDPRGLLPGPDDPGHGAACWLLDESTPQAGTASV
jgi:hypothetical protein